MRISDWSSACALPISEDRLLNFRQELPLFRDLSFPTISGAGRNGAIVHYRASEETNRALEPGSLYLVDSGAQFLDGTTDVTRTVAVGHPSHAQRDALTRVLKGTHRSEERHGGQAG